MQKKRERKWKGVAKCKNILYNFWGNSLARTTPGSKSIEDDNLVTRKSGFEFSSAVNI